MIIEDGKLAAATAQEMIDSGKYSSVELRCFDGPWPRYEIVAVEIVPVESIKFRLTVASDEQP